MLSGSVNPWCHILPSGFLLVMSEQYFTLLYILRALSQCILGLYCFKVVSAVWFLWYMNPWRCGVPSVPTSS